jgi:PAS domain S-box-containing protein
VKARDAEKGASQLYKDVLEALPIALYVTDAEGRVTFFNRAAAALAGREPELGQDRWCVAHSLYKPGGDRLALDVCPMAIALQEGRPVRGVSVVAERPDGSRVPVMPMPTPLYDGEGALTGGVNVLVDLSELRTVQEALARRADEQAALYRFTDRLFHSRFLGTAYEAALDAIQEAMRCERASILVGDKAGTMRFVAWRGLSSDYRRAVEGHSPWTAGQTDPSPIWVRDIEETVEAEALKATVMAEGIRGLAFVPLVADGGVVGTFMVYHREPHEFGAGERELALSIARQLGFSIEQKRHAEARREIEGALRQSEAKFRAIVDTTPECVTLIARDGRLIYMNAAGYGMVAGPEPPALIGGGVYEIIAPEHREAFRAFNERVCDGEPGSLAFDFISLDGRRRHMETRAEPFRDFDGALAQLAVTRDVSERVRADRQRVLLINELNHRVRNTLATVQSLAVQTLRGAEGGSAARDMLESRLAALARAHDLLTQTQWRSAELGEVVRRAIAPFNTDQGRFDIGGPDVRLWPGQVLALSIALHELATNAAKHGALTSEAGRVSVVWALSQGAQGGGLTLEWREFGGPPVVAPKHRGFGSRVIERSLALELGGAASIDYLPEGVTARISAPLRAGHDRPLHSEVEAAAS